MKKTASIKRSKNQSVGQNTAVVHLLKQAVSLHQRGQIDEAATIYEKILDIQPKNSNAYFLLGMVAIKKGHQLNAIKLFSQSIQYTPMNTKALHARGNVRRETDDLSGAIDDYSKAISNDPTLHLAYSDLGVTYAKMGLFKEAHASYQAAVELDPKNANHLSNLAAALIELEQYEKALIIINRALSITPNVAQYRNNYGIVLQKTNRLEESLCEFNTAIRLNPLHPETLNNRAVTLIKLKQMHEAIKSLDACLNLEPNYADAHNNRGLVLESMGQNEGALLCYERAVQLDNRHTGAMENRANLLRAMNEIERAIESMDQALAIFPDSHYLLGGKMHSQAFICDWRDFEAQQTQIKSGLLKNAKVSLPFPLLTLIDDPGLHLSAAQTFNAHKFPATDALGELVTHPTHDKVRIGYFSADFHNHATAYLMAELFEATDPSRFEVYGFSFGPNKQDEMRQRIANTFHSFIDVANHSDHQVAAMSRKLGIDIAVDLKGYTKDSRTGIFAARCAPIQVSYLGYPGTMGAPYIDYLIADHTLIPEQSQRHYSEKIVYMPHSYQANDSQRQISNRIFTRAELGLPALGFVFCCFNNSYKIMPQTFDSWMRILKAVNGSTLWLLHDNPQTVKNLKQQAQRRGVEPERLIFAPRMPLPEHLARHRVADLFLDTLPCNAHTTASDALWAGLPVLTLAGESFAARVAASLINAVGLPELVTTNQDQYEALAVRLANDPQQLTHLRQTLAKNRTTSSLFDGKRFAKNLGKAYQRMRDIHLSGQKPAHIYL